MHVGRRWQRTVLKRAAQRYAEHGWRVVPGAVLIDDRYVCGPLCPTVACHPAVENWETAASSDSSDVDDWWANAAFSVLLATGDLFDVIEVPARIGAPAAHSARSPVAITPTGRWMFLTTPGDGLRPDLAARLDLVLHGRGSWIPAPPTRTPHGRIRWHVHPAAMAWRLPASYAVQRVLAAHIWRDSRSGSFPTMSHRLGRAA